ncbi:O-antigen ligase family protein [Microbacterium sp. NPDC091313]
MIADVRSKPKTYLTAALVSLGVAGAVLASIATDWGGIALLVVAVMVLAVSSEHFCWAAYILSISATGTLYSVGPATARPELLGFIFLIVAYVHARRNIKLRARPALAPILSCLFIYLITLFFSSIFNAPEPIASLWILGQIAQAIVAFWLIAKGHLVGPAVVRVGTLVVGTIAVYTLAGYVATATGLATAGTLGIASDGRLIGISFENNIFASQMLVWLTVMYAVPRVWRRWEKFASVFIGVAILLAATRAAWLGLAVLLIVVLVQQNRRPWFLPSLVTVLCVLILAPLVVQQLADGQPRNSPLWRLANLLNTQDGTGAYRVGIFETAWSEATQWPRWIFGSGTNTYPQLHPIDSTNRGPEYLSNVFLANFYDGGVIALAALLTALLTIVLTSKARLKSATIIVVVLICSSTTNVMWFQFAWMAIGVAVSVGGHAPISNGRRSRAATAIGHQSTAGSAPSHRV